MTEDTDERRSGERRGKGLSANPSLNEFIYDYWNHYFQDRPDLNRRKQSDRRSNPTIHARTSNIVESTTDLSNSSQQLETSASSPQKQNLWEKFCSWFSPTGDS